MNKVSGPLLDRIDLHVEVTPVAFDELSSTYQFEKSETIRQRVIAAREIQTKRYEQYPDVFANAQMSSKMLKEICIIPKAGQTLLKTAMQRLNLSARAYDRIIKVSRTIADLSFSEQIQTEHLAEAIQYRSLDRRRLGWIIRIESGKSLVLFVHITGSLLPFRHFSRTCTKFDT
ncbi:MAG: hypothetical protein V9E88_07650 [Ferruginibacter sp.]